MKSKEFFEKKEILEKAFIDNNLEPEYTSEDYDCDEDDRFSFMYPGDHDIIIYLYFDGSIRIGDGKSEYYLFGKYIDTVISFIKAIRKRK
jgi:hypothetical protein